LQHFLSTVDVTDFRSDVVKTVSEVATQVGKDAKWRIRLGVVQQLHPLAQKLKNQTVAAEFTAFCAKTLEDEAFPVRNAAILRMAQTQGQETSPTS
jgi:hypothetical protein